MAITLYYFDTLPFHPGPERLESFTSYLTRLAELNGLQSLARSELLHQVLNVDQEIIPRDYPLPSYGKTQTATTCTEAALLETTFYHLGNKFGRSASRGILPGFLSGSLGNSLRYCPGCLTEYGYRSLKWRFLVLKGCYEHCCRLLDECCHCGQAIPLFSSPFRIAACPRCDGDLRTCSSETLSEEEREEVLTHSQDLEFLLSPQPWETLIDNITQRTGRQFALLRHKRHFTVAEVCESIGVAQNSPMAVEYGLSAPYSVSFQVYCKYVKHFGVSFYDIFNAALQQEGENERIRSRRLWSPPGEEEVIERIRDAVEQLKIQDKPVTQKVICDMIQMALPRLKEYPQALRLLKQISAEVRSERKKQAERHHDEMLISVMEAIRQLEERGECVTYQSVAQIVGVHISYFNYHMQARQLVNQSMYQYPDYKAFQFQKREDELVTRVEAAIQQLTISGQPVSKSTLSRIVGMRLTNLNRYPRVKALLEQATDKQQQRRKREEELLIMVEGAIRQLATLEQPITQSAVGKIIGMSCTCFMQYTRVRKLIQQRIPTQRRKEDQQDSFSEDEVKVRVRKAVQQLEALGQRVTQKGICKIMKMSAATLKKYPSVNNLLDHYKRLNQNERKRQARLHEDEVLTEVERSIKDLEVSEQPITRRTIAKIVGLSASSLARYPRVNNILDQYASLHQHFLKIRTPPEEELIEQVKAVIQQLRASGQPITQTAVSAMINQHPSVLKRYSGINVLFKEIDSNNRRARSEQAMQRADQLVANVEAAIQQLETAGLPITQAAISKMVGIPKTTMYYYPGVISLLKKTVKDKKCQRALEQAQLREKELVNKVLEAVEQLQALGRPVSKAAIAKMVDVSFITLNKYPLVKEVLQQIAANKSSSRSDV